MAIKTTKKKDLKPDEKALWRCDCGHVVKAEKEPESCRACGRTHTFSFAPGVVTK